MFALVLEGGETIRGVADESVIPSLAGHWGKTVIVSGLAIFRASGAVLRVEADGVEQFDGDLSIWSRAPRPVMQVMDSPTLFVPQGPRSGVNAIFGKWPGEEAEGEFETALEELS